MLYSRKDDFLDCDIKWITGNQDKNSNDMTKNKLVQVYSILKKNNKYGAPKHSPLLHYNKNIIKIIKINTFVFFFKIVYIERKDIYWSDIYPGGGDN